MGMGNRGRGVAAQRVNSERDRPRRHRAAPETTTFVPKEHDRIRDVVLDRARRDPRVRAGAIVGSFALGRADRWSDLDLSFAVGEDVRPEAVLDELSRWLAETEGAVHLFDLGAESAVYRVLLLPGALQVDISARPASAFRHGRGFQVVFGSAREAEPAGAQPTGDLFGWAVVLALHARACLERGRLWQADYDLNGVRERALALACVRRGLSATYGRGYDDLPADLLEDAAQTRSAELTVRGLALATSKAIGLLLQEAAGIDERVTAVEGDLRAVAAFLKKRAGDMEQTRRSLRR